MTAHLEMAETNVKKTRNSVSCIRFTIYLLTAINVPIKHWHTKFFECDRKRYDPRFFKMKSKRFAVDDLSLNWKTPNRTEANLATVSNWRGLSCDLETGIRGERFRGTMTFERKGGSAVDEWRDFPFHPPPCSFLFVPSSPCARGITGSAASKNG